MPRYLFRHAEKVIFIQNLIALFKCSNVNFSITDENFSCIIQTKLSGILINSRHTITNTADTYNIEQWRGFIKFCEISSYKFMFQPVVNQNASSIGMFW